MTQVINTRGSLVNLLAKAVFGALIAAGLLASSVGQAQARGDNLVAGALAGAAMGVMAGSAFAPPPPPPAYHVYRVRPSWRHYPPPPIAHDWDDPWDEDWDD